jgi:phytoene/squalene synthetase
MARGHYENFHVATRFLPPQTRGHATNIYAYCRWADDLADESSDPDEALTLLAWWREELLESMNGIPRHPVLLALSHTIRECSLPTEPFCDLLEKSANPVGRIFLRILSIDDPQLDRLSDLTCTGLQLANHWQDIERDLRQGRIYIPMEDMRRFGINEEDLAASAANDPTRRLIEFQVDRAVDYLQRGQDLLNFISGKGRLDIDLFSRGGLAICDAIRNQDHDVLFRRPKLGTFKKVSLVGGALMRSWFGSKKAKEASIS